MIECHKMKRIAILLLPAAVVLFLANGGFAMSAAPKNEMEAAPKALSRFEAPPAETDWATFHGDNYRSGYSTEKFIRPPLSVRWGFSTGGNIWSSPAVVAGVLFVGSSDGKLYSLDALTGNMRWAFKTGNAIFSSPTVDKGTVYFGSSDHVMYALDAETGNLKWYFETGDPITSSPAVDNGIVYFSSWDGYLQFQRQGRSNGSSRATALYIPPRRLYAER